LRALASVGVFREEASGSFALTPMASCLVSDAPGSMRAWATMFGEPWHRGPWSNILHSVRTGGSAFEHAFGMPFFSYLEQQPQAAQLFGGAMTSISSLAIAAVLKAYDFSGIRKLVDVGGGHGSLMAAILKANPTVDGVIFDLPAVITRARTSAQIGAPELAGRIELVGGDMFKSVPDGADAVIMKHIIHDWSDELALVILKNCQRAVTPGGRVLLVETVIPAGNDPSFGKLLDLEMLVVTEGGKERTEAEFRDLLAAAGLRLTKIIPTESPVCAIEAVRE
jgi:SAM-dependent methyltransferase